MTSRLNYNLSELKKTAFNKADVIFLLYLHFHTEVPEFHKLVGMLNLYDYPTLEEYIIKDVDDDKYYSLYRQHKLTDKLNYTDILYRDIPDEIRIAYLELVSKCAPYSHTKFIPETNYPSELVLYGLVKPIEDGVILTLERQEKKNGC